MNQTKEIKIFLNCMNSWFSNFLIEELRTDYLPKAKTQYYFMGTKDDSDRPFPYLFEPKLTSIEVGYNYEQEVFENDIIIFNLNDSNLEEVEFVINGLKKRKFTTKKILIIVSNIMTWANTTLKSYTEEELLKYNLTNEEAIPEYYKEKINENNQIEIESKINENIYSEKEEENNNEGEVKEILSYKSNKNVKEEIKEVIKEEKENKENNEINEENETNNENNNGSDLKNKK
jgi:hypothetical protein